MRYCSIYGGILLRKRGYLLKVVVKRVSLEDIETFQKSIRRRIRWYQKKGVPVLVQDEAIFVVDASPGRVYTPPGIRAVYHVSGTHDRTMVYRCWVWTTSRSSDSTASSTATPLRSAAEVKKEFGRALMIVDRAP